MSATTFSRPAWTPSRLQRAPAVLVVIAVHVLAIGALLQAGPSRRQSIDFAPLQVALLQPTLPKPVDVPPQAVLPQVPRVDAIEQPMLQIDLPRERAITVSTRSEPVASPPARGAPLFVSDVEYVRQPRPHYPAPSRREREQGTVVIRALIEPSGVASQADVQRSSGHERLDEAARVAVLDALFKPYLENGIARAVVVLIPIEFALGRNVNHLDSRRAAGYMSAASNND
jgi:protein TonB